MKKYIYLTLISIIFFAVGFYSFQDIEYTILGSLKTLNLEHADMTSILWRSLEFALICGIIPIVFVLIWKKNNIQAYKPKVISVVMFLVTTITFLIIRNIFLQSKNQSLKSELGNTGISIITNADSLHIPLYIFLGSVLGFIFAFFYLKKNKPEN